MSSLPNQRPPLPELSSHARSVAAGCAVMRMYKSHCRKRYIREPFRTPFKPTCPEEPSDLPTRQRASPPIAKNTPGCRPLTSAQAHHPERRHHDPQPRPPHHAAEHELVRHQLHQPGIDQYARAYAIKHALHNESRLRSRSIGPPDPQAHGHRNRRR